MDFVSNSDREIAMKFFAKRKRQVFEARFACKDETEIWGLVATTPIMESDQSVGWLVMVTDITEKKKLEAQFLQAQKMDAIGQLAGGVAHDFNNLLQVIIGYANLLGPSVEAGVDWETDLERIKLAAEKAAVLTRQLLAFGRRQAFHSTQIKLNSVIGEMAKMMERVIGEEFEIALVLDESIDPLQADPAQIEQVLMNLCVNARDAMPKGGRIEIRTGAKSLDSVFVRSNPWAREGDFVFLSFSDNGIGMPPEVLDRIFEPFFTTKPVGCGTGLGLSTVYGIVRQHDGFMNVSSEPGKGSLFEIYFPIGEDVERVFEFEEEAVEIRSGSETILIAEDDGAVRSLAVKILESAGYRVVEAANGEVAMDRFDRHSRDIDLAILDMVMPGMDGPTLRGRMRAVKPDMKFLFTTGYGQTLFSQSSGGMPAENWEEILEKPYPPGDLLKWVRKTLDRDSV